MRLVINSDRVIAALIKDLKCRQIILSNKFEFLIIDFTMSEIREREEEVLRKANLSKNQLNNILAILFGRILVAAEIVMKHKMDQARKIMDKIDPDDTPFIALALATDNDGIWTEDRHSEKQKTIRTWRTTDLLKVMKVD